MSKLKFLIVTLVLVSCQRGLKLEGNWVILEMAHKGELVYPETISDEINLEVNVAGYQGSEKVHFSVVDSTVVFPGFQSDRLACAFSIKGDSIFFKEIPRDMYKDEDYQITKRTFLGAFEIIRELREENLRLKSDLTIIRLVNEDYLFDRQLDKVLGK